MNCCRRATLPRARFGRSDHPPWPCRPCEKALMAATTLSIAPARHSASRSCSSSSGLDRYPSSRSTEGTSGALRTLNPAKAVRVVDEIDSAAKGCRRACGRIASKKALRLATHEVNENVGDIVLALFHLDPGNRVREVFRGSPSQPIRHPMGGPKPYRPSPRARCSAGRSRRGWK